MNHGEDSWEAAISRATQGMSDQGRRERRRHGRRFAAWCRERGLEPTDLGRTHLEDYLGTLRSGDPQLPCKARCSLRAIMREVDVEYAARSAGLGFQTALLSAATGTPLERLIDAVARQSPRRMTVRRSALGRLLAWCAEVGVEPTTAELVDLAQFRQWLVETGIRHPGEVMMVAKDFIQLRHSADGRRLLGEPEPIRRRLRIEMAAPLRPRFEVANIHSPDPLGTVVPKAAFVSAFRTQNEKAT